MLYVSRKVDSRYGVIDTEDGIEEFYTKEELRDIHKLGIEIKGITDTGIRVVNWEQEPEYIKAKTLHYQLKITEDNRVIMTDNSEGMSIPNFCCRYEYFRDGDGLMVMSGTYAGGNLNIPKFVDKLEIDWVNYKKITLSGGCLITLEDCFKDCYSLEEVYLGNLDVSKVKNMEGMFFNCEKLQNLDGLSNWNVRRVKNMDGMFCSCKNLQNIDVLVKWNVSNVKYMKGMFSNCKSLQNIDALRNWGVSRVENMDGMFYNCKGLQNTDGLRNWNVSKVKDMRDMFFNCSSLQNIDGLRGWNVSKVENMCKMFYGCENLQNIDGLRNWDVSNVEDMDDMFIVTDWWDKVIKRGNRLVIE